MREKAAQLSRQCQLLADMAAAVDAAGARMVYSCAAGEELRRLLAERHRRITLVVDDMRQLQHRLLRHAVDLELAQAAWRRAAASVVGVEG
jgi:hypothetical protein